MRIELEILPPEVRSHHPVACGICDRLFRLGAAIARPELDDDDVNWAEVCPECLASGPDGIVETLRRRADAHRQMAEYYRQIAEDYEELADEGVHDMPTPEELELMERLA